MSTPNTLGGATPIFRVANLRAGIEYYVHALVRLSLGIPTQGFDHLAGTSPNLSSVSHWDEPSLDELNWDDTLFDSRSRTA